MARTLGGAATPGPDGCDRHSELVAEGLDRVGEDVGDPLARGVGVELAVVTGRAGVALGPRQVGLARQTEAGPRPRRARRRGSRSAAPGRAPSGRGCGRGAGCWRAARSRSPGRRPRSPAARGGPCTSRSRARPPRPTGSARSRRCSSRRRPARPTRSRVALAPMWLYALRGCGGDSKFCGARPPAAARSASSSGLISVMMSSGPHTFDSAISTLVPAVLRVLRKMKRCWWDAITG